jgi:hypothetical protein
MDLSGLPALSGFSNLLSFTTRPGFPVGSILSGLDDFPDTTGLIVLSGLSPLSDLPDRSGLIGLSGRPPRLVSEFLSGLLILPALADLSDFSPPPADLPVFCGLFGLSVFIYSSSFSNGGLIFTPS